LSLVLDLDETLVHCSAEPTSDYDVTFDVLFNGSAVQVFVRKRPHLDVFLQQGLLFFFRFCARSHACAPTPRARLMSPLPPLSSVSQLFEVTVFTASQRVYAERLLDILDPNQQFIKHRLYRESCLVVAGNLLKLVFIFQRQHVNKTLKETNTRDFVF